MVKGVSFRAGGHEDHEGFFLYRKLRGCQTKRLHCFAGAELQVLTEKGAVFIEPVGDGSAIGLGPVSNGAINIYKRTVDGHLVTTLGEAPERAVRRTPPR